MSDHYAPRPGQFLSIAAWRVQMNTLADQLEGQRDIAAEALHKCLAEARQMGYDNIEHVAADALAEIGEKS